MCEDGIRNGTGDGNRDVQKRYEQVIASVEPKRNRSSILKPVIVEEEKERLLEVEKLVKLGMSVEQMQEFLPTVGIPASRSQVYRYLTDIKLPKRYKSTEREQSHHDFFTFRTFVRLARDMAVNGHRAERLQKGTAFLGQKFRPDFTFWVDRYLFFIEMQLSDLVETKWRVKFKNYLKLYMDFKRPFRVLFIIDQHGDMSYIRSAARQVQVAVTAWRRVQHDLRRQLDAAERNVGLFLDAVRVAVSFVDLLHVGRLPQSRSGCQFRTGVSLRRHLSRTAGGSMRSR